MLKYRTKASLERELAILRRNLNILEERRAKHGTEVPPELTRAVQDHHQAVKLVEDALRGELDAATLEAELEGLLLGPDGLVADSPGDVMPPTTLSVSADSGGIAVAGDENIVIAGDMQGDIIVSKTTKEGPRLLEVILAGIRQRWPALLTLFGLEAITLGAYLAFKDRHLIPAWQFWLSTALFLLAVGFWNAWLGLGYQQVAVKAIAIVSVTALGVVLGGSIFRIVRPAKFPPRVFGIAVARFGEGPKLKSSLRGQEISYGLIESLRSEAQEQEALVDIAVDEVGIVKSSDEARWAGQRIGADLVIWGRLVVGEEGAVTVHFEVLETPASALNPEYPRVLPIGYAYSAEVTDRAIDIRGAPHFDIKEAIASQSNAVTCFVLGLAFYLERDFRDALFWFGLAKQALATESSTIVTEGTRERAADPGLVHYYLGKSYQMLGRVEKAVEELEKAVQLNDLDPAAQLGLAYGYRSLERTEEAKAAARKVVALCEDILLSNPRSEEARYDLGLAYQMLKEHDAALDAYLGVIEVNPDFHIAYVSAGRIYALQDDFDMAVEMYLQAIEKAQQAGLNGAWSHVDLGDVYLKQNKVDLALSEYLTAVELEPEQDWMHFRLAQFYEAQGETDAAWQEYEQLVEVSANQAWANAVLGDFLRGQKLFDLAIERYRRAIRANPDDAMLSVYLGETFLERLASPEVQDKDAEKAEKAFGDALNKLPKHFPARFYAFSPRGRLYFHQGQYDLAIADFLSALEINPLSPEIQFSLARAYDAHGDVEEAISAYERVLEPEMEAAEEWVADAQKRLEVLHNR